MVHLPVAQHDSPRLLKADLLGTVRLIDGEDRRLVLRDTRGARWWLRWLARWLCRREARALARLDGLPGTPRLAGTSAVSLRREWLDGSRRSSHARRTRPTTGRRRLLVALHRCGVAHNDWRRSRTGSSSGDARIIDQLASCHAVAAAAWLHARARGPAPSAEAQLCCSRHLTERERRMIARPAPVSRIWMATGKPVPVRDATSLRLGRPGRSGRPAAVTARWPPQRKRPSSR